MSLPEKAPNTRRATGEEKTEFTGKGGFIHISLIPLLSERLISATDWLLRNPETRRLAIGYFGASSGAAAALVAAAERPEVVKGVFSHGGRPDLAGEKLSQFKAPVRLIVGSSDPEVTFLNREAMTRLNSPKELVIVPGATHLFEEPGTLEEVASLATS